LPLRLSLCDLYRRASIAQQLGELFVGGPQTTGRAERNEQDVD
jgi:hypothetical protein